VLNADRPGDNYCDIVYYSIPVRELLFRVVMGGFAGSRRGSARLACIPSGAVTHSGRRAQSRSAVRHYFVKYRANWRESADALAAAVPGCR